MPPSLRVTNTPLSAEPANFMACSLAALAINALSQVKNTMELTNRVFDQYVALRPGSTLDGIPSSGTPANSKLR